MPTDGGVGGHRNPQQFSAKEPVELLQRGVQGEGCQLDLDGANVPPRHRTGEGVFKLDPADVPGHREEEWRKSLPCRLRRQAGHGPQAPGSTREGDHVVARKHRRGVVEGPIHSLQPDHTGAEVSDDPFKDASERLPAFHATGDVAEAVRLWVSRWKGLQRMETADGRAGVRCRLQNVQPESTAAVDHEMTGLPLEAGGQPLDGAILDGEEHQLARSQHAFRQCRGLRVTFELAGQRPGGLEVSAPNSGNLVTSSGERHGKRGSEAAGADEANSRAFG